VRAGVAERAFEAGEALAEPGAPCGGLFFITSGLVDVQRRDEETGEGLAGPVLRGGDVYGTHAAETFATHSVRLTALAGGTLLALPAAALREALQRFPDFKLLFDRVLRRPAAQRLFARLAARLAGDEARLLALAHSLEPAQASAGARVQEAGAPVAALRIVERGALECAGADGRPVRLGPGAPVAAAPFLLAEPSPLRLTAAEDTALLALPPQPFREAPPLRRALADLVALDAARDRGGPALETDLSLPAAPPPDAAREVDLPAAPAQPPWRRPLPHVRQREEMDCGAACLRMVHRFHGHEIDERATRQLARVSRYGTSLFDLLQAGERLGYVASGVQVDGWDALRQVDLPAIAHVGGNHFVVVWRAARNHVETGDPASANQRMAREEFMGRFGGVLLLLRPTDRARCAPARARGRAARGLRGHGGASGAEPRRHALTCLRASPTLAWRRESAMRSFVIGMLAASNAAAVPVVIQHHGRLLDGDDQPVNGSRDFVFTLHEVESDPTLDPPSPVWTRSYTVPVAEGLYTVALGAGGTGDALDSALFDRTTTLYLQVKVSDSVLAPRLIVGSVPYAFIAGVATTAHDVECAGPCISGAEIADGAITPAKLSGGAGGGTVTGLDADKVDGKDAADFVHNTGTLQAGAQFAVQNGQAAGGFTVGGTVGGAGFASWDSPLRETA
jgi:CRP-like cAMP-binding protein